MKSALIAVALAFGIGVSATVTIEHSPDGSFRAVSKPDAPAAARRKFARSAACLPCRDKCAGAASAAPEFCESFLAATYTAPADFAPLETQCASDASRASSACSCFVTPVSLHAHHPVVSSPLRVQLCSDIDIPCLRPRLRQPRRPRPPSRLRLRLPRPQGRPAVPSVRRAPSAVLSRSVVGPPMVRRGATFPLETRTLEFASSSVL